MAILPLLAIPVSSVRSAVLNMGGVARYAAGGIARLGVRGMRRSAPWLRTNLPVLGKGAYRAGRSTTRTVGKLTGEGLDLIAERVASTVEYHTGYRPDNAEYGYRRADTLLADKGFRDALVRRANNVAHGSDFAETYDTLQETIDRAFHTTSFFGVGLTNASRGASLDTLDIDGGLRKHEPIIREELRAAFYRAAPRIKEVADRSTFRGDPTPQANAILNAEFTAAGRRAQQRIRAQQ